MELSDHDKESIREIDLQVGRLLEKGATDELIISQLIEFIPHTRCMINADCEKQLQLYCQEFKNFNYFLHLINQILTVKIVE